MAQQIDARVKQKTGTAAEFAGYVLLEGEMALVRTSASGPVWNFKVGPGNFDSLDWSLALSGAAQKADTSTVFPAGVPGLYIPTEDGTYEGVPVDLSVGYVQLVWDGSALTKVEFPIDLAGYATTAQLEPKVNKDDIGIVVYSDQQNIAPFLSLSESSNSDFFEPGYLRSDGSISTSSSWITTRNYHDILPGEYTSNLKLEGNAVMLIFDQNHNIIQVISDQGQFGGGLDWNLVANEQARWFKTSRPISSPAQVDYYIRSNGAKTKASDTVFITPTGAEKLFQDKGLITIDAGSNTLAELTGSDINNDDLWGIGYLHYGGAIMPSETWRYSLKNYRIYPGQYNLKLVFGGNARAWVLDKDGNIVRMIQNPTGSYNYDFPETFSGADYYLKISHNTSTTSTSYIGLVNDERIDYFEGSQSINLVREANESDNLNAITSAGSAAAVINSRIAESRIKSKFPVVTFISDDIHVANFDWYVPALDDMGVKSTFAAITGRLQHPNYADEDQIRSLYDNGHDIAGHTHSHLHTGDLPLNEQEFEIRMCKIELLRIIGDDTPMFVAPFGSRTIETDRLIRQYFDTDFITVGSAQVPSGIFLNTPPIETYRLKRVSFDNGDADQSQRLQLCKDAVDVALTNSEWLVFAIHPQYPEYYPDNNPSGWEERRQDLHSLVAYIRSLSIPIMTAKNAYKLWKNPVEFGNRNLDTKFMEIGMDGSRNGTFFA